MPIFQRTNHFKKEDIQKGIMTLPEAKKISLDELENRSKIFAHILRNSGCKEGAPVCCIMNNSIDFLISLLGIKYAECVSWPISPTQPQSRIKSVILDSKAKWLVIDSNAEPLLDANNLRQNSFNIAWMDSTEKIPENCFPEFVRDNIDHISMRPVYPEPSEKDPLITFQDFEKIRPNEKTFTPKEIEEVFSSILETVNIDSGSRIGGMLSSSSPLVLLQTTCLSYCEDSFYLFDSTREYFSEALIEEINERKISHLFLDLELIERLPFQTFTENACSVDELVLWGGTTSEKTFKNLKKVFPNATFYNVSLDQDKNLTIDIDNQSSSSFIPFANRLTQAYKS